MSQTKKYVHKVTVKNRPGTENKITTGMNTSVELDGVPLLGATFLKFEVKPKGLAKITIELLAEIDIEANMELTESKPRLTTFKHKGKPLAAYTLSTAEPSTWFDQKSEE